MSAPAVVPLSGPGAPRLVATLAIAGLLSGLAIVGTYEITLPRIAQNQARALRSAIFEVVPGADAFLPVELRDGRVEPADDAATADLFAAYGVAGDFLGWAIPGEGPGFQDTIGLLFGFDSAKRVVTGMQVLESRETPGLGDRIFKDPGFVASFRSLSVQPEIALVGKGTASAANEVDGITGATISSRAVVRILNVATSRWSPLLPEPGAEPKLPAAPAPNPETGAGAGAAAGARASARAASDSDAGPGPDLGGRA